MRDAGLDASDKLLLRTGFSRDDAYETTRSWLSARDRDHPTALYCTSDELALGALRAAAELGVGVSNDLAVVGFDDVAESKSSWPPLTTVRQPVAQMAAAAIDMLLRVRDTGQQQDRMFGLELAIRATCGC